VTDVEFPFLFLFLFSSGYDEKHQRNAGQPSFQVSLCLQDAESKLAGKFTNKRIKKIPNKPTCLKIFVFLSFQLPRVLPETAGAVECKIKTVSVQLQRTRAIMIKNIILRRAVGQ